MLLDVLRVLPIDVLPPLMYLKNMCKMRHIYQVSLNSNVFDRYKPWERVPLVSTDPVVAAFKSDRGISVRNDATIHAQLIRKIRNRI